MEITSGGTPGPRLAQALWDLGNNVYGTVHGPRKPAEIAALFASAGWRVRRSSWTDCEIEHTWARIEFLDHGEGHTILAGVIDPRRPSLLAASFDNVGLSCTVEINDP